MDPRFQTSFIPKKPVMGSSSSPTKTINLFALIATLIFIATIALAISVFFYNSLIVKQITDAKTTLDRAKGAFEPDLINKIVRLDTRIGVAQTLLANHLATSYFFDIIERVTLKTVRFKDFSFEYLAKDKVLVSMKGQAQSFTSVALESDALNAEKTLKDTIISDLALDAIGTVSFNVVTTVDSSSVIFKDILKQTASLQSTTN